MHQKVFGDISHWIPFFHSWNDCDKTKRLILFMTNSIRKFVTLKVVEIYNGVCREQKTRLLG